MNEEISYRYKTFGAAGTVVLKAASIASTITWRAGKASFELPFKDVDPNPTHQTRRTGMMAGSCLLAIVLGIIATMAIIDSEGNPFNIPGAILLFAAGLLIIYLGWRYREDHWIVFSCRDAHRTISFAKQGPNAKDFELFTQEVQKRLKETQI